MRESIAPAEYHAKAARMKKLNFPLFFLLGFVCSTAFGTHITDLGVLQVGDGEFSFPSAINESGQVVGTSRAADNEAHVFLYQDGHIIDLYPFGGLDSSIIGINNAGQIASGATATDGRYYPAILQHGNIHFLGSLGGSGSDGWTGTATAISNNGKVAGYARTENGENHAFLYDSGVMHDLGCGPNWVGPCFSYALDVNDHGQVVGVAGNDGYHAFLYENGVMTLLDPFHSSGAQATAINNRGQVVGGCVLPDLVEGFIYERGTLTGIIRKGSPYTFASGINEKGQVVGGVLTNLNMLLPLTSKWTLPWAVGINNNGGSYQQAILFENGVVIDLNTLLPPASEWKLSWAVGINNNGRVTGFGVIHGHYHAFLLKR
jgi:probable HAF family extracellular repeat protein